MKRVCGLVLVIAAALGGGCGCGGSDPFLPYGRGVQEFTPSGYQMSFDGGCVVKGRRSY